MTTTKPKIALLGYGAMGKEIEKAATADGLIITDIFDIDNPIDSSKKYEFDVAIDFSIPSSVLANVQAVASLGKSMVIGTTGWNHEADKVLSIASAANIGLIYDSNFSIGMHIFQKIVKLSAQLLNSFPNYDIMLNEIHHNRKIDHPSGTALTLAEIIVENLERKTEIATEHTHGMAIKPEQLDVSCSRVGDVAGTHRIYIDSAADSIEIAHIAKNRTGLAAGAVFAANWIHGKHGIHRFRDIV